MKFVFILQVFVLLVVMLLVEGIAHADTRLDVVFTSGEKLRITEKANLRKYQDGRFIGLSYREVRSILQVGSPDFTTERVTTAGGWSVPQVGVLPFLPAWAAEEGQHLRGQFYVFEETKRENRLVAKGVDTVVPAEFFTHFSGEYAVPASQGYPSLRSFPIFPERALSPGDVWEAFGERVVEPFRDSRFTRVRFYCQYRYEGTAVIEGIEVDVISAQYALRYKRGDDPQGDKRIDSISGKHVVTIHLERQTGSLKFMRDTVDELYKLAEGGSLGLKGFILTWFDGVVRMDRDDVKTVVTEALKEVVTVGPHDEEMDSTLADISVESRDEGVALSLNRIHFVADQAVILPEEEPRLEAVAQALMKIEGRTFLVVGHTARIGTEESQYTLSVERAKTIVDYLVAQGIDAERFIYEGKGGTEPIAPNDIEENMAKNRRVEIIILED